VQLAADYPEYRSAGARILVISAQEATAARRFLARGGLPFPWLLDVDRAVMRLYGVYNRLSYDAWRVAHPAAVLIDRAGVIRFIYRSNHQWDIPRRNVTLDAVGAL